MPPYITRYIRCHLNWSDHAREDDRLWRNRIKEKELEELVVVLFAKVEIPRP